MISLIVAAAENDAIGVDGELPWHLPDDLRRFKELTLGKPVIMGRKTWESIGRALPDRQNIVITRQNDYVAEGCDVVRYPAAAILAAADAEEIMVIGGSRVYEQFLRRAERVYMTRVHGQFDGDAFFPGLDDTWELVAARRHAADEAHEFPFTFEFWERTDHF